MGQYDENQRNTGEPGSTGTESGSDWGNSGGSGMGDSIGSTGTDSGTDWGNAGGSGMGDQGTDMGGGSDVGGGSDIGNQEDSGQGM